MASAADKKPLVLRVEITAEEAAEALDALATRLEQDRSTGVDERAVELAEREARLRAAEEELEHVKARLEQDATASDKIRLGRREQRVRELEELAERRLRELEERESQLDVRAAELEADALIREDGIEHREIELDELERRLHRKESELASYVAQLQAELLRREGRSAA